MNHHKRSVTTIVDNEEHEKLAVPPVLLSIENETLTSETEIKEGDLLVNQILNEIINNALEMSRKKTTSFGENCSRQFTNIVENEENERVSQPPALVNMENNTSGKFL